MLEWEIEFGGLEKDFSSVREEGEMQLGDLRLWQWRRRRACAGAGVVVQERCRYF